MITVVNTGNEITVGNETFEQRVIARAVSHVGVKERENGEHTLQHPFIAFFDILRKWRGAENKAERDAIESELRASGVTDKETIDAARSSVKSSMDNGRTTVAVLRRLHGEKVGTGQPIEINANTTFYKDAVRALKKSVGGWDGHIDVQTFQNICNGLSAVFARADNSSITAQDLGFMPESMDSFLLGEGVKPVAELEAINEPVDGSNDTDA